MKPVGRNSVVGSLARFEKDVKMIETRKTPLIVTRKGPSAAGVALLSWIRVPRATI